MLSPLRKLFSRRDAPPAPAAPQGERLYAVGDIHGRHDLFAALVHAIDEDDSWRTRIRAADTTVILLGDLVDRGPDSRGVIGLARVWGRHRRVRALAGNHEEMMLGALENPEILRHFVRAGGRETLLSFGITPEDFDRASWEELFDMARAAVDAETRAYLEGMEPIIQKGDYCFVHAGVKPGVALEEQLTGDLRWIREPFLSHPGSHGAVIVHGHTITEEPQLMPNRIGLDTGAYASGRLTALGLEGTDRWLLTAQEQRGGIAIHRQELP